MWSCRQLLSSAFSGEKARRLRTAAVFMLLVLPASMAPAYASCGPGKQPTSSDIRAIRYTRTSCLGKCHDYEVLFSGLGSYYVGRRWVAMSGTYEAPAQQPDAASSLSSLKQESFLKQAVRVLIRHDFFNLNADPRFLTDVPHLIIAVDRCDVTTKLDFVDDGQRPDIEKLFDGLDVITGRVPWKKTSDSFDSPLPLSAMIFP